MNSEPLITAPCAICGGQTFVVICPANEVAAHLQYLRQFHRRRLRSSSREMFADRATFTQDYVTAIVACTYCGLVFRTPHPSAQAITAAYQHDHYGRVRLLPLFSPRNFVRIALRHVCYIVGCRAIEVCVFSRLGALSVGF